MEYSEIFENIKTDIDWELYSKFITLIAKDKRLNIASNRFEKSNTQMDILEILSKGKFNYVDQKGYDFEYNNGICIIEDKSEENLFHNLPKRNGNCTLKKRSTVMLKNTMGTSNIDADDYLKQIKYDILFLRQTREDCRYQWVGCIKSSNLKKEWISISKDQVILKLPIQSIDWVYTGSKNKITLNTKLFSEISRESRRSYIKNLMKEVYENENNDYCI